MFLNNVNFYSKIFKKKKKKPELKLNEKALFNYSSGALPVLISKF